MLAHTYWSVSDLKQITVYFKAEILMKPHLLDRWNRKKVVKNLHLPSQKYKWIPNGLEMNLFTKESQTHKQKLV